MRTSYAAGPSILQCKSCQGCLGALVPAFHTQKRRDKATEVKRERIKKKHHDSSKRIRYKNIKSKINRNLERKRKYHL
jgi:hypothetical protein